MVGLHKDPELVVGLVDLRDGPSAVHDDLIEPVAEGAIIIDTHDLRGVLLHGPDRDVIEEQPVHEEPDRKAADVGPLVLDQGIELVDVIGLTILGYVQGGQSEVHLGRYIARVPGQVLYIIIIELVGFGHDIGTVHQGRDLVENLGRVRP
jgi:hypothetical protein